MPSFCRLVTRWTPAEIARFEGSIQAGDLHPRDAKMKLAYEITATFYDENAAQSAQEEFINLFQKHALPEEISAFACLPGQTVLDVLVACEAVVTRNAGRRLIEQKGVHFEGQLVEDSGMESIPRVFYRSASENFIGLRFNTGMKNRRLAVSWPISYKKIAVCSINRVLRVKLAGTAGSNPWAPVFLWPGGA